MTRVHCSLCESHVFARLTFESGNVIVLLCFEHMRQAVEALGLDLVRYFETVVTE